MASSFLWSWPGALALTVALITTAGLIGGMTARAKPSEADPTRYTAADFKQDLAASCAVTGCDADALTAVYRAGLPAMTDADLAEAGELADLVAQSSAEAVSGAAEDADGPCGEPAPMA